MGYGLWIMDQRGLAQTGLLAISSDLTSPHSALPALLSHTQNARCIEKQLGVLLLYF
jgi:hypothetical protein